jgi:NADP-dependent 3-hydroxy acid dehydrogenase YdfG
MTREINKKFVVITGVTKGLGRAMVDRFSELGWLIAGCGRSASLIEEMRNQFSEEHDFQKVDVSDAKAVADWGEKILDRYGAPDLLINNPSIVSERLATEVAELIASFGGATSTIHEGDDLA